MNEIGLLRNLAGPTPVEEEVFVGGAGSTELALLVFAYLRRGIRVAEGVEEEWKCRMRVHG